MATGKKFYWIRLQKEFMTGDEVDFLMSQDKGSEYVVLYQMLCLMCINSNGEFARKIGDVIIPFDISKIQRDCKYFSKDTIRVALELYKKLGLIYEQCEGILAISRFSEMVGSESDYARQKKLQRKKNSLPEIPKKENESMVSEDDPGNAVDNTVDIVHTDVHSNVHENVHTEKEIEIRDRDKSIEFKERERDKDTSLIVSDETICRTEVRRAVEKWNSLQSVGISPVIKMQSGSKRYKMLVARIREYGNDAVLKAIDNVKKSKFLTGNVNNFIANFDWFVKPNNFPKVLEGNYADNQPAAASETKPRKKIPYNSYQQREYSTEEMNELEKKLLQGG